MISFGRVGNAAYRDVPGVYVSCDLRDAMSLHHADKAPDSYRGPQ
jgi:hypothetical protein